MEGEVLSTGRYRFRFQPQTQPLTAGSRPRGWAASATALG